jgi:hypothetical protein
MRHAISVFIETKLLIAFPHLFGTPHIYYLISYLKIKIYIVTSFRSYGYGLIIIAILRSA